MYFWMHAITGSSLGWLYHLACQPQATEPASLVSTILGTHIWLGFFERWWQFIYLFSCKVTLCWRIFVALHSQRSLWRVKDFPTPLLSFVIGCVFMTKEAHWETDEKLPQSKPLCFWMGLIRIAAKTLRACREGLFHFPVVFCHPQIIFLNYFRDQKIYSKNRISVSEEVSLLVWQESCHQKYKCLFQESHFTLDWSIFHSNAECVFFCWRHQGSVCAQVAFSNWKLTMKDLFNEHIVQTLNDPECLTALLVPFKF